MKYLDANIFIYAILNDEKYGRKCKKILLDLESSKLSAGSSIMLLSELINALIKLNKIAGKTGQRKLDIEKNIEAMLSYPLTWFELNFPIIKRAASYDFNISGNDHIHIAAMDLHGIREIISADQELDKVPLIKRIDPLDY